MFRIIPLILFLSCAGQLLSQSLIHQELNSKKHFLAELKTLKPFEITQKKVAPGFANNLAGEYTTLSLDEKFTDSIGDSSEELMKISVPINKEKVVNLVLERKAIFSPDFTFATSAPVKQLSGITKSTFYWGYAEGYPKSLVVFSVFDGEVSATINLGEEKFTLAKARESTDYILYQESNLIEQPVLNCHTDEIDQIAISPVNLLKAPGIDNCVRLHLEIDYDIYARVNNVNAIVNYIAGAFSEVIALYANESIKMSVSHIKVWNTPDPFTGPDTGTFLNQFTWAMNQTPIKGDLAHLIGLQGSGGVAFLGGLCTANRFTAYSAINLFYDQVPNYSWTVNILAHEVGHNLGSPHTHSCAWNGNFTQIDDCGNVATNQSSSCYDRLNPIIPAEGGTIMSYCHLVSSGVDLTLGFGQQPGGLMRYRVYNLPCLSSCEPCNVAGQICDDGDACTINDTYDADCLCIGTKVPDNDSDGYCQSQDQDDNDPCIPVPCDNSCTSITIAFRFDSHSEQTSCHIKNSSGQLYYSIAFNAGYGTYAQEICLPPDCYQFVVEDTAGNGMCCDYGSGSYSFTENNGLLQFYGGSFGSIATHDFCVDNSVAACTPGMSCDDNDPCTENDFYDANCNCIGVVVDSDGDGICDAADICPGGNDNHDSDGDGVPDACDDCTTSGQVCDDGDICTTNDFYDSDCNCQGTFTDNDDDGICDAYDLCPNGDDTVDIDSDGIPDACDYCTVSGQACNDGDPCTTNDIFDSTCNCHGTFMDSDGDGICDALDDDSSDENDLVENCLNLSTDDFELGVGHWEDGGIDAIWMSKPDMSLSGSHVYRLRDDSGAYSSISYTTPYLSGTVAVSFSCMPQSMEHGEDLVFEVNRGNGYEQLKSWVSGSDFNDLVRFHDQVLITNLQSESIKLRFRCDASTNYDILYLDDIVVEHCQETVPSDCTIGSPCNDNDACTVNDILDSECNCRGTAQDSDDDGICDAWDICPHGDDTVDIDEDGVPDACDNCSDSGKPCDDGDPCTVDDVLDENCECKGSFEDSDGDGICDALDENSNDDTTQNCIELSSDDFENDSGSWIDGGSDAARVNEPNMSNSGNHVFRLRDNSGEQSSLSYVTPSLSGAISVAFSCVAQSMELGEELILEVERGFGFQEEKKWTSGVEFTNLVRFNDEIMIKGLNSESIILRFRCNASTNSDLIYLDDVSVEHCPEYQTNDCIIDSQCEDGDPCTIGDYYDSTCACLSGAITDDDNDGYCSVEDADDTDPCIPDNSGCDTPPCDNFWFSDFENGLFHWNLGGSDALHITSGNIPVFGQGAILLRDNGHQRSSIYSNEMNLTTAENLTLEFEFHATSFEAGHDFILELTNNGGGSYYQIKKWTVDIDFKNNETKKATASIPYFLLNSTSVVRIRSDADSKINQVYLDNITLSQCTSTNLSGSVLEARESLSFNEEFNYKLAPNPVEHVLKVLTNDEAAILRIFDINGRQRGKFSPNKEMDLSALAAGLYFVHIESESQEKVIRFIKM